MNLLNSIKDIDITGILDIGFMSLLIFIVIIGVKRTRAAFVLTGIFIIAFIYLLTRQFNLIMAASVFEKFFAVIFVILVVIFQEELRHFFEEVAVWSLNRRHIGKKILHLSRNEIEILVRTLMDFARERTGALIVIRGKNIIKRHLDGEINLNGELSEPLLKSLFDTHSIGHDGAVIIDRERVTHFSCHLPLSRNLSKIKGSGTRHAAALGLSEVTDALCLVVSEEKGTISVTRNGEIEVVNDPEKLILKLEKFYEEIAPVHKAKPFENFFKKNTKEKIYSILLAAVLWFVLVHGSKLIYKSFVIPISHVELSDEWTISEINPKYVAVTLRGPRSAFYFKINDRIKVYIDMKLKEGVQNVRVSQDDFIFPKGLIVEDFDPNYVKIVLNAKQKKEKVRENKKMEARY